MKKILFLSTGGTIASAESEGGLTPQISGQQMVTMIPELEQVCEIVCKEILNLDSTNIQPEEWKVMAEAVCEGARTCDGIVIAHGTDTMAYSAAALTFMLKNLNKPVVLTGSQLPIENPHTDAKRNMLDAFRTAADGRAGVYIVFHGRILRGVRARKMYTKRLDAFHSINVPDEGKIKDGEIIWRREDSASEGHSLSSQSDSGMMSLNTNMDTRVFLCKLTPGIDGKLLESVIDMGYRGIVLEAFGCGGVPYFRRSLLSSIHRAIDSGAVVAVATQCEYDGCDLEVYEVGRKAAAAGCLSGMDMTAEALVVKMMWALGNAENPGQVRKIMNTCYAGEFSEISLL